MKLNNRHLIRAILEFVKYDSKLARTLMGQIGILASCGFHICGNDTFALKIVMYLHRNAVSEKSDRYAEKLITNFLGKNHPFRQMYIDGLRETEATRRFFERPESLIGSRVLVLKSPENGERGVVVVDYSFIFPLLAQKFDLKALFRQYHLILEPSWSGACDNDILALSAHGNIFVQTNEPRDAEFLKRINCGIEPVPIAANWWVDTRVFHPLEGAKKDAHVFVNASWASFKRHEYIFRALRKLRDMGRPLKTVLVGYPVDRTAAEIERIAERFGVIDQIEIFENVNPKKMNELINRTFVNLVWSRREGSNRAIVEGLAAGVPGVMRRGFNYGFSYPFISESTVLLADESSLPQTLLEVVDNYKRFAPRAWIEKHMNPCVATQILDSHIERYCVERGEKWTRGRLAIKVSSLHEMRYWNAEERGRYERDYESLRRLKRG